MLLFVSRCSFKANFAGIPFDNLNMRPCQFNRHFYISVAIEYKNTLLIIIIIIITSYFYRLICSVKRITVINQGPVPYKEKFNIGPYDKK